MHLNRFLTAAALLPSAVCRWLPSGGEPGRSVHVEWGDTVSRIQGAVPGTCSCSRRPGRRGTPQLFLQGGLLSAVAPLSLHFPQPFRVFCLSFLFQQHKPACFRVRSTDLKAQLPFSSFQSILTLLSYRPRDAVSPYHYLHDTLGSSRHSLLLLASFTT
jgi:hypothetical protein